MKYIEEIQTTTFLTQDDNGRTLTQDIRKPRRVTQKEIIEKINEIVREANKDHERIEE